MAIVNVIVKQEDGFVASYDYDNQANIITAVHIVNNSQRTYNVMVTITKNGRQFTRTIGVGQRIDRTLPKTALAKLEVFRDARGRVDGADWSIW